MSVYYETVIHCNSCRNCERFVYNIKFARRELKRLGWSFEKATGWRSQQDYCPYCTELRKKGTIIFFRAN
jgi:hypothetical protein